MRPPRGSQVKGTNVFSRFFIDRPIFASVLSIIITLIGGLALLSLPLAQFPRIAPPTVSVTCNYPGASARTWPHPWRLRSSSSSTASRA